MIYGLFWHVRQVKLLCYVATILEIEPIVEIERYNWC